MIKRKNILCWFLIICIIILGMPERGLATEPPEEKAISWHDRFLAILTEKYNSLRPKIDNMRRRIEEKIEALRAEPRVPEPAEPEVIDIEEKIEKLPAEPEPAEPEVIDKEEILHQFPE